MEQQIQQLVKRIAVLEYTVTQLSVRLAKLEKNEEKIFPLGKINVGDDADTLCVYDNENDNADAIIPRRHAAQEPDVYRHGMMFPLSSS